MTYELILCGSGFASTFFLQKWLEKRPETRVLVLERGRYDSIEEQILARSNSSTDATGFFTQSGLASKEWLFTVGLGGGSNCWWGQTPRMWVEDFELQSRFGVGYDWPISYADIESYYEQAEDLMQIAGPSNAPYPRRSPLPQPEHKLSSFDRAMIAAFPDNWMGAPTARSSLGTQSRGICCANGVCGVCPVDAKFRVMNDMANLYQDLPNVEVRLQAEVTDVVIEGGRATGVAWREAGRERSAKADLIFLGMNALFNPYVLKKSGDDTPLLGKRLNEQASLKLTVDFEHIENFDGGTHITGLGYMFYGGEQRRNRGSCIVENYNAPSLLRSE